MYSMVIMLTIVYCTLAKILKFLTVKRTEMTDMLTNLTVVIISQYIHLSNYPVYTLNLHNVISQIKLEKNWSFKAGFFPTEVINP